MEKNSLSSGLTILIFIMITGSCVSPSEHGVYMKIEGFAQGTSYHITYELPDTINLQHQVDSILHDFDLSLSSYDSGSVISKLNRNEVVKPDEMFCTVFNKSWDVFLDSDSLFDITVMPLVNAWGFGPGKKLESDSSLIDSLLDFVGMEKIRLENGTLVKTDSRIQLDVNAIAQGYSVDIVSAYLERLGSVNYLVEIGGEIRAKGKNLSGQNWKVGIDKPEFGNFLPGEELQAIIELHDRSLATSGNYRRYYEENGVKYTHTINPKTGYPVNQTLLSATIIAGDCITADAYATVCMVSGLEKSKQILLRHPEMEAYLIYGDIDGIYQLYLTPGMQKFIVE